MKDRARTWLLTVLLGACSAEPTGPVFHPEENPETLSAWEVLRVENGVLHLSDGATPYDLATPLFSDYALKLRTISLPEGAPAGYAADDVLELPVGTILSKTFYYETGDNWNAVRADGARSAADGVMPLGGLRLLETRILAHRADGWVALPYVWNDEQTEAILQRTGEVVPLTLVRADGRREDFSYLVPNTNQCAGCHATDATLRLLTPIGLKARHLNKPSSFQKGFNQLDHWRLTGLLEVAEEEAATAPGNADWLDDDASVDARARAYLDANCSHCHSPTGPADASGLDLRPDAAGPALGLCKSPIAAGGGSGGRPYDIVPGAPDDSITVFRMETNDPGAMMPELGRAVVHEEAVLLIREWIETMTGGCW